MSDKKERRKKKSKEQSLNNQSSELENEEKTSTNMISYNPNTDIIIKLGQLVSIKTLLAEIIDTHPECQWSSDEVLRLGMWMEELNKHVRENAIDPEDNENID